MILMMIGLTVEVGAGHTVTALYEIKPTNAVVWRANDNPFIDRSTVVVNPNEASLRLRLRYQPASGGPCASSRLMWWMLGSPMRKPMMISAGPQPLLRGACYCAEGVPSRYSWAEFAELSAQYRGRDPHGYRAEAKQLMRSSRDLVQLMQ